MTDKQPVSVERADGWHTLPCPENDGAFHVYHPSLVNADFNPQGVVEAVNFDGIMMGAVWNDYQDCWETVPIQCELWRPIVGPTFSAVDETTNARAMRLGKYVTQFALNAGWKPGEGEGPFEFIQRHSYAVGYEDAGKPVSFGGTTSPTRWPVSAIVGPVVGLRQVGEVELKRWGSNDWEVNWRGDISNLTGGLYYREYKVGDKVKLYAIDPSPVEKEG